jgi:hypothetical protein
MSHEIPVKTRWEIVFCRERLNLTQNEIARQTGCCQSTVSDILAKYQRTGDVVDLPRTGRKRLLNLASYERDQNPIIQAVRVGDYTWRTIEQWLEQNCNEWRNAVNYHSDNENNQNNNLSSNQQSIHAYNLRSNNNITNNSNSNSNNVNTASSNNNNNNANDISTNTNKFHPSTILNYLHQSGLRRCRYRF